MNTRVFRINLDDEPSIDTAIVKACDKQLADGFRLASTFLFGTNLVLIFQKT